MPQPGQWHGVIRDGEVYQRMSLTDTACYFKNLWTARATMPPRMPETRNSATPCTPTSGFKAVSIAAKDCAAPARYIIQGTKGYIMQKSTANCCGGITFHPNEGKEEHYNLNGGRPRQAAEFEAFARALESGDQELCGRMQDTTIAVSRVLTVARRNAGIRFPCDH